MLKFLTHKLKSQSITEVRPFPDKSDDERDSGTESDDENLDVEDIANDDDGNHHDTSSYGSLSPVNHPPSPGQLADHLEENMDRTHEITEHSLETTSFASDLEGRSWEFGRHSSEEELAQINREGVAEKRKWSQVLRNGCCDSAGSSDEEVKELMLGPHPVIFRASPPKGVQKLTHSPPAKTAKYIFKNVSRVAVAAISPRKRHRHITEADQESGVQRPCLDFEKMQKTSVKKPCAHSFGRPKIVKIRGGTFTNLYQQTIAGSTRSPKCLFDPSVFSFRAINSTYSPLAPVEEPSCAY